MDVKECLENKWLVQEQPKKDLIDKELKEAEYDLKRAENALKQSDYKWAIIMRELCKIDELTLFSVVC